MYFMSVKNAVFELKIKNGFMVIRVRSKTISMDLLVDDP